ncbi:hypothetical protein CRG98_000098 [Punica granatum]|uniref:Uncharacterized protein n=1 Tax=Punica granatum TaxID=22663 RepID=A0A2I0LFJ8_PUNGR|nr:hypothetical protein CRG98_000098 [Punica granatum]
MSHSYSNHHILPNNMPRHECIPVLKWRLTLEDICTRGSAVGLAGRTTGTERGQNSGVEISRSDGTWKEKYEVATGNFAIDDESHLQGRRG